MLILGICDRWHVLPSQAYEEDAAIVRLLQIESLGRPRETDGGDING